ncbi:hypothetical protein CCP3SC15_300005 [Gammaproteobacteria bacterium]
MADPAGADRRRDCSKGGLAMVVKSVLIAVALFFVVFGQDPCTDARYIELKSKPLDSMSQREYDYFTFKDKECTKNFKTMRTDIIEPVAPKVEPENCQILVTLETIEIERMERNFRIFIDDVDRGYSPVKVVVAPGFHTVSLFSNLMMDYKPPIFEVETHGDLGSGFSVSGKDDEHIRMISSLVKVEIKPGASKIISYHIGCDLGGNRRCDEDEWFIVYDVVPKN